MFSFSRRALFLSAVLSSAFILQSHQAVHAEVPSRNPLSRISSDFNTGPVWAEARGYTSKPQVAAKVAWSPVGSYNVAGSSQQSKGWKFSVDSLRATNKWSAGLQSGVQPLRNPENELSKLTLSFTLAASSNRPVRVYLSSYNSKKAATGTLQTLIYPASPNFLQRYALDLNTLKRSGSGQFDPRAPYVDFKFELDSTSWPKGQHTLAIDDINLSGPAFYVSPKGNDSNDGRTPQTAFATPQKALDVAGPGDIVLLMGGTYDTGTTAAATFTRAGLPAAWIVLKNYPGQIPTLTSTAWNIVNIRKGSKTEFYEGPALAYLEVRGVHIRGIGDTVREKYPDSIDKADPLSNSNGIAVDGRYMKNIPHHLRFADNLVEYCPAQGLGCIESDWVTFENNVSRYNCWTTIYGTSGISTLGASNFDPTPNIYKMLIRNNVCYRNETFVTCRVANTNRISDGNGIILDVNQNTVTHPTLKYHGRTLVQNNLSFDNGGSGIHTVKANHVDIVNNTAYLNSASKDLQYSQIYGYSSQDVRVLNNIMVAPVADVAAGEKPEPVNSDKGPKPQMLYANNLYFGGNIAPNMGAGDKYANPLFVNASRDPKTADFHLRAGSPAIGLGRLHPFVPFFDADGKPRGARPDSGAFQK